jgi:hypothetical protein
MHWMPGRSVVIIDHDNVKALTTAALRDYAKMSSANAGTVYSNRWNAHAQNMVVDLVDGYHGIMGRHVDCYYFPLVLSVENMEMDRI